MDQNKVTEYYESKKKKLKNHIDLDKMLNFNFVENKNGPNFVEILIDGNVIINAEYSLIGVYDTTISIWYWATDIAFVDKKLVEPVYEIKRYLDNFDKYGGKFDKNIDNLHYILSNNNFYISGENIEIITRSSLYIAGGEWIFPVKNNDTFRDNLMQNMSDKIVYVLITKILQYY